jgi:aspartyl-tRNA(Asn)/glutamyl-tRNA(Gln) amidotransferase subunit A
MSNLVSLTLSEMREGLLRSDFSSLELTNAHLERIESTNSALNSFITISPEQARAAATAADKRIAQEKEDSPPLCGIPYSAKDMLVSEGIETTCGSKMLAGFCPPYNCTVLERLADNGAVLLGKNNMDEFAMGSSSERSSFGAVRNPWDLDRVPGGSSGGSAVAVSSGQSPFSLGTDTGGSIRQPAAFTGTIGLKPTYGRVSRYGAVAYASSFDQIGPIGRSVEDVACVLQAISGKDELDSTSMDVPVESYLDSIRQMSFDGLAGLRIGVPKEYFSFSVDEEIDANLKTQIAELENLGAELVDISLPHTEHALASYYILVLAEASSNLSRFDGVRYGYRAEDVKNLEQMYAKTRAEGFGTEVKRRIMMGSYVLSAGYFDAYYIKAQQVRTLIISDFKAAFANDCDVILAPVSPTPAFGIGEKTTSSLEMYLSDIFTVPVNLAGLPAISIPSGLTKAGLPIGVQLIGQAFKEEQILGIASALEQSNGFAITDKTQQAF